MTNSLLEPKPYRLQLTCSSIGISSACLSASCLTASLSPNSQVILIWILITLIITQLYASLQCTFSVQDCTSKASVAHVAMHAAPIADEVSHTYQLQPSHTQEESTQLAPQQE